MVLDCHIHIVEKTEDQRTFARRLAEAGVDGGIIFSRAPAVFEGRAPEDGDARRRLAQLMDFTAGHDRLFPFYFIDPTEPDAGAQVELAARAGVRGFKVICGHHYPQDERAMPVYAQIARLDKPLLFHSGILYNRAPSGEFNRPCNFEHLFAIDRLRFALAHVSWPWCDELIAVFGKWNHMGLERGVFSASMYVDLTPGTPPIYREEVLSKLIRVGYGALPDRMIFGSDATSVYDSAYVAEIIARDSHIYDKLGVSESAQARIFGGNLLAFVGGGAIA